MEQAIGMQLKRSALPGQPLQVADLVRPPVVPRDTIVRVVLEAGGLSLSGQLVALEAGAMGERIRVRNPSSRAVLEAEVIGPGLVRASPQGAAMLASTLASRVTVR